MIQMKNNILKFNQNHIIYSKNYNKRKTFIIQTIFKFKKLKKNYKLHINKYKHHNK